MRTACVAADLGAESGRVVAGTFDGERLALEEVHRFPNVPVRLGGQLVWDLPGLLRGVVEGLGAARDRRLHVESVGVASWGVDFVLLDRLGRPVGSPVHYRDARTEGMVEELRRRLPPAELYDRTGIQFVAIDSLVRLRSSRVPPAPASFVRFAARASGVTTGTQDERFTRPGDVPGRVAALCRETGQEPPLTPAATARTLLEGLALAYRRILDTVENVVGWRPERVHVVGGGARNALLCQWTADATGLPVWAGPVEATATGNVLLQLLGLGRLSSLAEGRELVRRSLATEIRAYEPGPRERWDAAASRLDASAAGSAQGGGGGSVLRG